MYSRSCLLAVSLLSGQSMCWGGSSVYGSCQAKLSIVGLFGWWPVLLH